MADITRLARVIGTVARNQDLTSNTLVVQNLKVNAGTSFYFTFSGTPTAVRTIDVPDADVQLGWISNLVTLSGVSGGSNDLGTFTGSTIPANSTIKTALQALQTSLESQLVLDSTFRIQNSVDNTKKIAFSALSINTGNTRTITMPNADVDLGKVNTAIQSDGSIAFANNQSMGGYRLTNLSDPSSNQDPVTLAYMNARLNGLTPKAPAVAATTTSINLSSAPASVDTVTLTSGNRVLVKDQAIASQNGIYIFNGAGSAMTRASDMDSLTPFDEFNGAWVTVQQGSQAGQVWVQYGTVTTVGTDPINFSYYNPIAGLIGGDMITFSSSTFSVDLATVSGLESTNPGNVAGQLRVKLEASNPTLQIDGSNQLGIKLDGARAITTGSSGIGLNVDNSTVEIATNALRIKDSGVTASKIAASAVDGTTISGGGGSALSAIAAPAIVKSAVAGQSFSANITYAIRWGVPSLGETAGRVYAADYNAATNDLFWVIGVFNSGSVVSAGQTISFTAEGTYSLASGDTTFGSNDIGKPVWLGASGAIVPNSSASSSSNIASSKIAMAQSTSSMWIHPQMMGVN